VTISEMKYATPIECMPWCENGDGHPTELSYVNQNCYSAGDYLRLPLNSRHIESSGDEEFASISVTAKRELVFLPCVHVHLMMPDPDVDVGVKLTAQEARWLAAELLARAELVEGPLLGTESP
jgi:hypothetical protein